MDRIFPIIFLLLLFAAIIGVAIWIFSIAFEKQFVVDCFKWQSYEKEYPLFELDASMVEACQESGVKIK